MCGGGGGGNVGGSVVLSVREGFASCGGGAGGPPPIIVGSPRTEARRFRGEAGGIEELFVVAAPVESRSGVERGDERGGGGKGGCECRSGFVFVGVMSS